MRDAAELVAMPAAVMRLRRLPEALGCTEVTGTPPRRDEQLGHRLFPPRAKRSTSSRSRASIQSLPWECPSPHRKALRTHLETQ